MYERSFTKSFLLERQLKRKNGALPSAKANILNMSGGSYLVESADYELFFQRMAADLRNGNPIPPISELRSVEFPFFVDLDLVVAQRELSDDAVATFCRIANEHVRLFYSSEEARRHLSELRCVACTKGLCGGGGSGLMGASMESELTFERARVEGDSKSDGAFKHGIHLHWPRVIVDEASAKQMAFGLAKRFERFSEWGTLLGDAPIDWPSVVDLSVYRGGLRPLGATKVLRKCCSREAIVKGRTERGATAVCSMCHWEHNGHVLDHRVYRVRLVVSEDGNDEADALECSRLSANAGAALRATTVFNFENRPLTSGFAIPPSVARYNEGKRKLTTSGKATAGEVGYGRDFRSLAVTPPVDAVVRKYLLKHSPNYALSEYELDATVQHVAKPAKMTVHCFRVRLRGDGANFCLNKQGSHASSTAYMLLSRSYQWNGECYSMMRCFCRKPVQRCFGTCKEFEGPTRKLVDAKDWQVLVAHTAGKI